jgi:predicted CXXCH cytochrome family protein
MDSERVRGPVARTAAGTAVVRGARIPTIGLGLLFLALVALPARASIEGSPHDLIAQGYDVQKASLLQERCTRCHLATSPAHQGFLPEVPPVLERTYGGSSLACFSCHDGTTIVSPVVDASRTAFHPASHGNDLTGYEGLRSEDVGLPYLAGKRMECVTCHDPHDNGHRPFLRADLQEICLSCHSQFTEFGRGKENRTGNHILGIDPAGAPRPEVPLKIADAFRAPYAPPYPMEQGKGAGEWHWDLGGHLAKGGSGAIGCGTCHAVHGDEAAAPTKKLLAIDPVNEVANLFCEGCHAGQRGDGKTASALHPNPGGTTTGRTYHAVDDDEANGYGRSLEIREPPGWPFGGGTPRRLLCTTCHTAHGAWVQTPLLRAPPTALGFCEECHEQIPDYHHVSGVVATTGCGSQLPAPPYGTARGLVCASCHQAHNAGFGQKRESDYVPLLLSPAGSGALCAICHPPLNPTCNPNPDYRASHFIGDPSLDDTFVDKTPPQRVEPWPESGLASVYGGDKGLSIVCLSCHAFRAGALVSGDDGTARHLIARAGNRMEWTLDGEALYLCTGCHGARPATAEAEKGHTHPLMDANVLLLGREPTPPLTGTPSGKVNCDSCHRSHEALTRGGVYILEAVDGANPDPLAIHTQIDFTVLCHGCHDAKKY